MNKRQNKRSKFSPKLAVTSNITGNKSNDRICMSRQLQKQNKVKKKKTPIKRRVKKQTKPILHPMPTLSDLEKLFNDSEVEIINPKPGIVSTNLNNLQVENSMLIEENISNRNIKHSVDSDLIVPISVETTSNHPIKCENLIDTIDLVNSRPNFSCNEIIIIDDEDSVKSAQGRKRNRSELNSLQNINNLNLEKANKIRKLSRDNCELTECGNDGFDSDITIVYDFEGPLQKSPVRCATPANRFSPLPSTSTDNAIILENDKSFLQSLCETGCSITEGKQIEQNLIETVFTKKTHRAEASKINNIDDGKLNLNVKDTIETCRVESPEVTVIDDEEISQTSNTNNRTDLDSQLQSYIVEDLTDTSPNSNEIDVDALIAENWTILTKYRSVENRPAVINVRPKENINQTENTTNACQNLQIPCDINQSTPDVSQRMLNTELNSSMARQQRPRESHIHNRATQIINSPNNSNLTQGMGVDSPQSSLNKSSDCICPICYENLRTVESASTACGHIFCMCCIKRALKNARRCPTCRKTLKAPGYHRLFL